MRMKGLHTTAWVLVMIGGLDWLLVGLGGFFGGDWNVIHLILGSWPVAEWIAYLLIGISAIYEIVVCRSHPVGSGSPAPAM